MARNTIEIEVNTTNGDITVTPGYAHAKVGDEITWNARQASSLLLLFKDGTAFGSESPGKAAPTHGLVELRGKGIESKGTHAKAFAQKPGMFAYQFSVVVNGEVYADMSCPEIIIQ